MPNALQLLYYIFLGPLLTGVWAMATPAGSRWQQFSVLPVLACLALLIGSGLDQVGIGLNIPLARTLPGVSLALANSPAIYYRVAMVLAVYAGVHLYSTGYIVRRSGPYFGLLSLFSLGMLTLVLSGNYLTLLLGWEVIGLCSYALISTYFGQPNTGGAAMKVFVINRFGDAMLLAALGGLYARNGYLAFPGPTETLPDWIGYLLAGAALVKSAQVPFSAWLRMAMVGPSPVSALLHAATLVVAGVLLILKTGPALGSGPATLIEIVGMLSALYGASRALFSHDLKAVLAWSTVSHMGLLMASAGTIAVSTSGALSGAGAHILAHAFFKAPLFLLVGLLPGYKMHALASPRLLLDKLGSMPVRSRILLLLLVLCALSAVGAPLMAGAFSKEAILGGMLAYSPLGGAAVLGFIVFYTLLSTAYMARFVLGLAAALTNPDGLAHWVRPHHVAVIGTLSLGVLPLAVLRVLHLNPDPLPEGFLPPYAELVYGQICLLAFVGFAWWMGARPRQAPKNPFSRLLWPIGNWHPEAALESLRTLDDRLAQLPLRLTGRLGVRHIIKPLLWLEASLASMPLLLARSLVVLAHIQKFVEQMAVGLAAYTFKAVQWPVRALTIQVTGYRISMILVVALLTLAGLVLILGW